MKCSKTMRHDLCHFRWLLHAQVTQDQLLTAISSGRFSAAEWEGGGARCCGRDRRFVSQKRREELSPMESSGPAILLAPGPDEIKAKRRNAVVTCVRGAFLRAFA